MKGRTNLMRAVWRAQSRGHRFISLSLLASRFVHHRKCENKTRRSAPRCCCLVLPRADDGGLVVVCVQQRRCKTVVV